MPSHASAGLVMLFGLFVLSASAREIYRWTDAEGRVHFGDKPSGPHAETLRLKHHPAAPAAQGPEQEAVRRARTRRLLDEYAAERTERDAARAADAEAREKQRRRCTRARQELAELEQSAYVYTRDETGRKQIQPDTELRRQRELARAEMRKQCGGD